MHVLYRGVQSHSWCTSVLKSFDLNCLNTLSSKFLVIRNNLIGWFRSLIRIECKPEVSNSGPWGPMFLKVNLSQHTCLKILVSLMTLIQVKLGLELNSAGQWTFRSKIGHPCISWTSLKVFGAWIDPSQRPAPLVTVCYIQQAMALSRHTSCEKSCCSTEETETGWQTRQSRLLLEWKEVLAFKFVIFK